MTNDTDQLSNFMQCCVGQSSRSYKIPTLLCLRCVQGLLLEFGRCLWPFSCRLVSACIPQDAGYALRFMVLGKGNPVRLGNLIDMSFLSRSLCRGRFRVLDEIDGMFWARGQNDERYLGKGVGRT